jgi:spermidine synthase
MAILWQKRSNGALYEVRSAGRTRRLYTDGIFHSQFNPANPVTGSVWDLLLLPAFFHRPEALRRVLVLGVGGGAVVRQLLHFIRPETVVGVELEPLHLQVARRFFGLRRKGVALHCADARAWVHSYGGPPFDLVIEDLFGGLNGEPVRAIAADTAWFDALGRLLALDGTLVMNFPTAGALRECAYCADKAVRRRWRSAFRLTNSKDENAVGAFLRTPAQSRTLRTRLSTIPTLDPRRKSSRLDYRIRRL